METLALDASLGLSTVREAIGVLTDWGWLGREVRRGRGRSNQYVATIPEYFSQHLTAEENRQLAALYARDLERAAAGQVLPGDSSSNRQELAVFSGGLNRQETALKPPADGSKTASSCHQLDQDQSKDLSRTEDSSEDEESSVPGLPGGTNEALIEDRNSLLLALSAEIATQGRLTRREHGAWNLAVSDLLEVGATIDDVQSRCRAYRELFPKMPLTPSALVNQWNLCGTHVAAPPTEDPAAGHERWLTKVCGLPDADLVDLLADRGFAVDEIPAQVERARELRLAHAAAAAVTERAIREGRQAA